MNVPYLYQTGEATSRVGMLANGMLAAFRLQLQTALAETEDPDFQEAALMVLSDLGYQPELN